MGEATGGLGKNPIHRALLMNDKVPDEESRPVPVRQVLPLSPEMWVIERR
jgi:hypothetical protein